MKANELRLGNWIKYKNSYAKVENMSSRFIMDTSDYVGVRYTGGWYTMCVSTAFKPIELTEEVLLKIGFSKYNDVINIYSFENESVIVIYAPDLKLLRIEDIKSDILIDRNVRLNNVEYLHQLQNVYYLLIGKELEVSL